MVFLPLYLLSLKFGIGSLLIPQILKVRIWPLKFKKANNLVPPSIFPFTCLGTNGMLSHPSFRGTKI